MITHLTISWWYILNIYLIYIHISLITQVVWLRAFFYFQAITFALEEILGWTLKKLWALFSFKLHFVSCKDLRAACIQIIWCFDLFLHPSYSFLAFLYLEMKTHITLPKDANSYFWVASHRGSFWGNEMSFQGCSGPGSSREGDIEISKRMSLEIMLEFLPE